MNEVKQAECIREPKKKINKKIRNEKPVSSFEKEQNKVGKKA